MITLTPDVTDCKVTSPSVLQTTHKQLHRHQIKHTALSQVYTHTDAHLRALLLYKTRLPSTVRISTDQSISTRGRQMPRCLRSLGIQRGTNSAPLSHCQLVHCSCLLLSSLLLQAHCGDETRLNRLKSSLVSVTILGSCTPPLDCTPSQPLFSFIFCAIFSKTSISKFIRLVAPLCM